MRLPEAAHRSRQQGVEGRVQPVDRYVDDVTVHQVVEGLLDRLLPDIVRIVDPSGGERLHQPVRGVCKYGLKRVQQHGHDADEGYAEDVLPAQLIKLFCIESLAFVNHLLDDTCKF